MMQCLCGGRNYVTLNGEISYDLNLLFNLCPDFTWITLLAMVEQQDDVCKSFLINKDILTECLAGSCTH